jgi:predicted DNA-binding antitoxin AbrB/MazE fold protein
LGGTPGKGEKSDRVSMIKVLCVEYENSIMKPAEIVFTKEGGRGLRKSSGGESLIKAYFIHICKYHY